jgi:hypothetical protein
MKRITMTLAFAAIFITLARGQGFQNLDFESIQNLPGNPGNGEIVPTTNALPSWAAYNGPNVLADVSYVSNSLGDVSGPVRLEGGSLALSGNFSVGLYQNGGISQAGLVSDNAESLQFEAYVPAPTIFVVTLGGQSLSYSAISEGSDYTVYGANIPGSMDGQMELLTFLEEGATPGILLDNIEFSSMSVPEPSQFALIGLGAILFKVLKASSGSRRRL